MLNKFKGILAKVCPSPEKIKDFFLNYGKKIDAKIQNSDFEELKKCWNSLKEMALSQDNEEVSPEEIGIETQDAEDFSYEQGEDNDSEENDNQDNSETQDDEQEEQGSDEDEQQLAEEEYELYEEGIWDTIKKGWNSLATPDKPTPRGRKTTKRSSAKKPTSRKAPLKKAPLKKGVQKKPAAKKTAGKKAPSKGKKKSAKQMTAKEKILKFLREHWKQITIVLIAAIAVGLLGAWAGGAFATSSAVTGATKTLTKFSLPAGMKTLPKGAKLIANGVVKFANGSMLSAPVELELDD